jgi:hypothetical protein
MNRNLPHIPVSPMKNNYGCFRPEGSFIGDEYVLTKTNQLAEIHNSRAGHFQ